MRIVFTIILFVITLCPGTIRAEEFNAGFVQGIWFGDKTVFADTPVRIYVALRNNTDQDLTGTVRFMDNEKRVGVSYVSALPGRIIEAWTDWTPSYGEHTVTATLSNTQLHPLGESAEIIEVVSAESKLDIFVDYDTDKDGVGNATDSDDDGDGVSDADETARGTDPLVRNEPEKKSESNASNDSNDEDRPARDNRDTEQAEDTGVKTTVVRPGLEKYIENETVNTALSKVTNVVTETKQSLDTFRAKRSDEMDTYLNGPRDTGTNTTVVSEQGLASSTGTGIATITRTRAPSTGSSFFESALAGGKAIVSTLFSLALWLLSEILAHPALIQLALLFIILLTLYSFARRFGRRPTDRY